MSLPSQPHADYCHPPSSRLHLPLLPQLLHWLLEQLPRFLFASMVTTSSGVLCPRTIILFALLLGITSPGLAVPADFDPTPAANVLGLRQDVPTTTSSFDWWPYPSWGALTATSSTTFSLGTLTQDPVMATSQLAVVTAMTTADDPSAVTSTLLADATQAATATLTSSVSNLVQITALPPANSSNSITRARVKASNSSHGFDVVYLAPLFAVLGAIAGGLCTWLLYRFVPTGGRSLRRAPSLEPGPRYTPPSLLRPPQDTLSPAPLAQGNLARPSQSSGRPLLEAAPVDGDSEKKGSWISRALSGRSRLSTRRTEKPLPEVVDGSEDDPFLDHSSPTGTPSAAAALGLSGTQLAQRSTSPDPYGAISDEEDLAPYETLRHKSIRRGIIERLRFGSTRRTEAEYQRGQTEDEELPGTSDSPTPKRTATGNRRGHKRDSSDMKVTDMYSHARTSSGEGPDTPSRRPTLLRNRSELVTSPPGFRLVVEDPESGALMSAPPSRSASPMKTPTKEPEGGSWGWNLPWSSSPTKRSGDDDRFTALPVRRGVADRRNSPYSSPAAVRTVTASTAATSDGGESESATAPDAPTTAPNRRVDSSILPASPPMVMSPPLESQLFFGAIKSPNFGSSPSLDLRMPESAEQKRKPEPTTTGTPGEKHKKLKTHRSPPALPFQSTASGSPFRGRLKKSPTKKASAAAAVSPPPRHAPGRADSADSVNLPAHQGGKPKARGTPAERHEARASALSRVDEILSRSWSERQLGGEGFPGSPTNFGAFLPGSPGQDLAGMSLEKLVEEEALNGVGIEQRLGALGPAGV
ncbi:hypothetical protein BD413DRAFT_539527 [Trametes elegans]|nr:hypothetical protein BD413DRAFT_539527 [Trametes elegans]